MCRRPPEPSARSSATERRGAGKAEGWVPRYMAFPPAPYDGTKSIQAVEAWGAISQLFATS
ncbi:hypothetical protein V1280_000074 [Bradyrhizobium sp. AZCC 2230]